MREDPIVAEVRRIRERILADFDYASGRTRPTLSRFRKRRSGRDSSTRLRLRAVWRSAGQRPFTHDRGERRLALQLA